MSTKGRCRVDVKKWMDGKVPDDVVDFVINELESLKKRAGAEGRSFADLSKFKREKLKRAMKQRQVVQASNLEKTISRGHTYKDNVGDAKGRRAGVIAGETFAGQLSTSGINRKGIGLSVEAVGKLRRREYQTMLIKPLQKDDLMAHLKGGALDKEISIELFELRKGGEPGKSKSVEARKIAEAINTVQNKMINDLNGAGLPINKMDGYIIKQSHDAQKILGLDADPDIAKGLWAEKILPMLDHNRMFEPDLTLKGKLAILRAAANTLVDGSNKKASHLAGATDELITVANYKTTGKGLLEERVIHFKDGETFHAYNNDFGTNSIIEAVTQSISTNSKTVGAVEKFGSNPEAAIAADRSRIQKQLKNDPEALKKFNSMSKHTVRAIQPQVLGFDMDGTSELLAKGTSLVSGTINIAKLGAASIWSITDIPTAASMISGATGQGYMKSLMGVTADVLKQVNPKEKKLLTEIMAVYMDDMIAMNYGRLGLLDEQDFHFGWTETAQQFSFMASGLNWVTNAARNASALGVSRFMGESAGKSFKSLPAHMKQTLRNFDISPLEWNTIRAGVEKSNRGPMIVADFLEPGPAKQKLQLLFNSVAEMGSPEPSARTKARITQGHAPGSVFGSMLRLMGQFKSFPLHMHDILKKTAAADPSKDFVEFRDVFSGQANYKGMAQLAISTTLMAYVAASLRSVAKNETPPDPSDPKTWLEAMTRGGAAGIWGDILLADHNRYGGNLQSTLGGPALDTGAKAIKIGQDVVKGKDVRRKALDFAISNFTPNTFYLKTGLDMLFLDDLREVMEPGYKAKKRRRQMRENRDKLF